MMQRYPAYKDSGFDWLGEIPAHWEIEKLKHVSTVKLSGVDKKSYDEGIPVRLCNYADVYKNEYIDAGLNFMSATATKSEINNLELKAGDVIITKDSETWDDIAVPAFVPENLAGVICAYHLALIRANSEKVIGEYLFRAIMSIPVSRYFHISSNGVTRYGLTQSAIKQARIPIPPKDEQEAIATFLREQTAVINQFLANKRQLITLLEEQKQVVINTAVTQGLDPNAPRKPSGIDWLGDIPAHWEIKKLKYVAEVQTGLTLGQKYPNVPLIERPYLRVANVQDGYLDLAEITTIQLPVDKAIRYELEMGDVLMTEGGDFDKLGRGYVWEGQIDNCLHQNHIFAVRPNKEVLKPYFLTAIMSSLHGKEYFIESSKQTTNLASINSTKLKRFPILLPTLKEQQDILDYLEQKTAVINTAIERTQREIELIEEYRTTLIAHAVTGKIDVRVQGTGHKSYE